MDGSLVATNCKTIALLAESGLGKTNAILNFIHDDLNLPSRIRINVSNKTQKKMDSFQVILISEKFQSFLVIQSFQIF